MAMKAKARRDIEVIEWFAPDALRPDITDDDREAFSRWSSTGQAIPQTAGTRALGLGKTRREAMVAMLRQDLADGVFWRHEFEAGFPPVVAAYLDRATRGIEPRAQVVDDVRAWLQRNGKAAA